MHTAHSVLENFEIAYPLEKIINPNEALFFNIATTGYSAMNSQIYLIGCAYFSENQWHMIQWFAEEHEEAKIITEFFKFSKDYRFLVHYNGSSVDLPLIEIKCKQHALPYTFKYFESLDLYKYVSPYKFFLKLPDCSKNTVEQFLQLERQDVLDGAERIELYREHTNYPTPQGRERLLSNNRDEIKTILELLPILSYYDLFNGQVEVRHAKISDYTDWEGVKRQEMVMEIRLPEFLPQKISIGAKNCYFKGQGVEGQLKVRIFDEEMKLFYSNYKDYYYLPAEDTIIRKMEALSIPREQRKNATLTTCYTRKKSKFLPQWDYFATPFYKREYKSKDLFFEITDDINHHRDVYTMYANYVLKMLYDSY